MRFSIKQDLQAHQEKFHERWSYYKCNFCDHETECQKYMQRHLKIKHVTVFDAVSLEKLSRTQ